MAKQAADLDILSNGRFRLGVGLGWNEVEYEGKRWLWLSITRISKPIRLGRRAKKLESDESIVIHRGAPAWQRRGALCRSKLEVRAISVVLRM